MTNATLTVVLKSGVEKTYVLTSTSTVAEVSDFIVRLKNMITQGKADKVPGALIWGHSVIDIEDIAAIEFGVPADGRLN